GTSMRQIARDAGVSLSNIYNYFPGKQIQQSLYHPIGVWHRPIPLPRMPPPPGDGLDLRHPLRRMRQDHDELPLLTRPNPDRCRHLLSPLHP
ncbi:MAG TPA: TetR/AcrR family transcriptional regulator, partial [Anaerolineae bacterium]|nr:TetR/AcrR family transcriptional regulator [Anaerolineae bacterium]